MYVDLRLIYVELHLFALICVASLSFGLLLLSFASRHDLFAQTHNWGHARVIGFCGFAQEMEIFEKSHRVVVCIMGKRCTHIKARRLRQQLTKHIKQNRSLHNGLCNYLLVKFSSDPLCFNSEVSPRLYTGIALIE